MHGYVAKVIINLKCEQQKPISQLLACLQVLDEIRPYLVGTGGGGLSMESIDGPIVKIKITGPAASVMTVR